MEKHKVTTDITDREKIFINPNNGERLTKLKGGEKAPDIENKERPSGGSTKQQNQEGKEGTPPTEDTKPESLSVEKRMDKIEEMFGRVLEKLK